MRRPLVLTASRAAVEQARALGFHGGCLENAVEGAIIAGRLPGTSVGGEAPVNIGDGLVVICAKVKTQSGRKGWRPLTVRRLATRRAVA